MEKPSSLRAYFSTSDNMWLAHSKFNPQIRRLNCGFNDRGSISSKTSCSNHRSSWLGKEWGIVSVDRLATPSHENVHSVSFQAPLLERPQQWMTHSPSALTFPRVKFCHPFLPECYLGFQPCEPWRNPWQVDELREMVVFILYSNTRWKKSEALTDTE